MANRPTDNDVKIVEIDRRHDRVMAIIRGATWIGLALAIYLPLGRVQATFASFAGEETIVSLNWPVAAISAFGIGIAVRVIVLEFRVRKQRDRIETLERELMDREGRIDALEQAAPVADNDDGGSG